MAAPNLPTLVPTNFDSQSGTTWTTTTFSNIDETVASADGLLITAGTNSTSSIFYKFTDMPSDFVKILTLNYNIRYQITSLAGDTETLFFRVWDSTKTTAYTNESTVVTTTANIALTNKGSTALTITAAGLSASADDWHHAVLEIRTLHSALHGNDGSVWSIDAVELTGTYDAPPTTILGNPADSSNVSILLPTVNFTGTDPNSDAVEYVVDIGVESISSTVDLKYLDIRLRKSGSPTDDILIDICSGSFSGTVLGTTDAVSSTSIPSDSIDLIGTIIRFTFATPVSLSCSTKYYMVVRRSGARDTSNFVSVVAFTSGISGGGRSTRDSGVWSSEDTSSSFCFSLLESNFIDIISQLNYTTGASAIFGDTGTLEAQGQSFTVPNNPLIRKFSSTDTGFTSGHPFTSGVEKQFTVQAGDELTNGVTYQWRVRAIDPSGSNIFGAWSTTRSFTVVIGGKKRRILII